MEHACMISWATAEAERQLSICAVPSTVKLIEDKLKQRGFRVQVKAIVGQKIQFPFYAAAFEDQPPSPSKLLIAWTPRRLAPFELTDLWGDLRGARVGLDASRRYCTN